MQLIKKLPTRIIKGRLESWGLFLCPYCLKEVERSLSHGKKCQSCGCKRKDLISKKLKGQKRTEEQKKNYSKAAKLKKHTKESRQKIREANIGKRYSEETNKKKGAKGKNHPYFGVSLHGMKNPNWQGGISNNPYSLDFNKEFKQFILERDNYICQDPRCIGKSKRLCCHHIDYDKNNNNPENLISLCNSCHTKTNGKKKRKYFTEFYQNIMIGRVLECLL